MTSLLPPEFNTVTLTGQYVNLDGTPVAGYLTFTASPTVLKASASKDIIVPVQIMATLDGSGHFSVTLPATDDPDINPENWTYKVLEGFGSRREYSIQIQLEAGDTQNIFDLAPIALANGTFYDIGPTGPAGPPALIVSGPPTSTLGGTGDYAIDATNGILYGPKDQVTGWQAGKHLAAVDIAAHAALATTHGVAGILVGTTDTQTLSNKILVAPAVTGGLSTDSLTASGAATVGGALAVAGDVSGHDVTGNIGHFSEIQLANAPSAISDAVRKDYVDNTAGTASNVPSTLVRRDGTGQSAFAEVALASAPADPSHATRRDYVDGQDAALRRPAVNAQTGAYIVALSDERKIVQVTSATPQGVTVPPNSVVAFPVGTVIDLLQAGAGSVTAVPGSGVTINAPDGNKTTRGQWSTIRLQKLATDTWVVSEDVNSATAQAVSAATDQATVSTLVKRDANGDVILHQASVSAGAPTAANHLVRKDYVDANFVGKGVSAFNSLETATTLILDQQSADPSNPATANAVNLWKANDHGIYVLGTTAGKRRMKAHWGSMTGFPALPLPGDTVFRTDIGTNGSLWQYTGVASLGSNGWLAEGQMIICTSTTRPATDTYRGLQIFETDTYRTYQWTTIPPGGGGTGTNSFWQIREGLPGFRAVTAGTGFVHVTNNQWLVPQYDQRSYDPWGMFPGTTNAIIPLSGYWRIYGSSGFALNGTGQRGARISFSTNNGTSWAGAWYTATLIPSNPTTITIAETQVWEDYFDKGTQVRIECFQNSGGALGYSGSSDQAGAFSMNLIRQTS